MNSEELSQEFREIQAEAQDEDPNIRGMAAIELGSFAGEHPEYRDRIISILQNMLNDQTQTFDGVPRLHWHN